MVEFSLVMENVGKKPPYCGWPSLAVQSIVAAVAAGCAVHVSVVFHTHFDHHDSSSRKKNIKNILKLIFKKNRT